MAEFLSSGAVADKKYSCHGIIRSFFYCFKRLREITAIAVSAFLLYFQRRNFLGYRLEQGGGVPDLLFQARQFPGGTRFIFCDGPRYAPGTLCSKGSRLLLVQAAPCSQASGAAAPPPSGAEGSFGIR